MIKRIFYLVVATAIVLVLVSSSAHAGTLGWVWTSAPSSAQVGDVITVSAKYYKSQYSVANASFCTAHTPDGWTLSNGPSVTCISEGNGTAQIKINSKGNGVFYVIAMADNAPNSDFIKVTIGSTSSSPVLSLSTPVSESTPGTTVKLTCSASGGTGAITWSISSPVADTVSSGIVQFSNENISRAVTITANYSGLTKSVSIYVKATCAAPTINPGDGTVFTTARQKIVLSCATDGATIHYTLDGSLPTYASEIYSSAFNITNDTTIKAFAVVSGYYDSPITTATLTKYKETLSEPEISAKNIDTDVLLERHKEVSIASKNDAVIYYTLDGSVPSRNSTLYEKPFYVFTGALVQAIAILDGWNDSNVSSLVVTDRMSLSDVVNCTNLTLESSTWTIDATQASAGMYSLTSGSCADGATNAIYCETEGMKTISFRWKCSCEDDPDDNNWDYLCFLVNGEEKARIDGNVDWQEVTVDIGNADTYFLSWEYRKDSQLSAGEDCGWLDALSISELCATNTVTVSVTVDHGGMVEGAGTYDLGATVTLTAVPNSGYVFSHWTGAVESMENPLTVKVDVPKTYTAVFVPMPVRFTKVTSATNGVTLVWNQLAWATIFRIFRGVTSVPSSVEVVAELPNTGTCEWLDETGKVDVEYRYWIEAEGVEDEVISDPMSGKKKWGWPTAQNEDEVAAALDGAADARLGNQIGSVEEYEAFRAWAAGEGREEKEVRDSAHAWPSYALGAEGLFENEPSIQIAGFAEGESERRAAGFSWEIRVSVKDGERAAGVDADKVAALFEATRRIGDWTEDALLPLTVRANGNDGEVLLFDVTIETENVSGGFLRLGHGAGDREDVAPEETDPGMEETDPGMWETDSGMKYLVVDLSGGPTATSWPVTYMNEEPKGGFNTDEYKTTKLVLRRIEPGTFMMGGEYRTTLTKPYYMGVFEVTQKQYALVTGSNPSGFSGDMRPVERVSWDALRGNTNWPVSSAVTANSFMGRLRSRTRIKFDLPTEAQWEYACRAGTTTVYSYGNSADGTYMWYKDNSASQTHDVGMKKPNPWGFHDMHGNVWEWCLDWYGELVNGASNPQGASSGDYRVRGGGSWFNDASICTSSYRGCGTPSGVGDFTGFRIVCLMSE